MKKHPGYYDGIWVFIVFGIAIVATLILAIGIKLGS